MAAAYSMMNQGNIVVRERLCLLLRAQHKKQAWTGKGKRLSTAPVTQAILHSLERLGVDLRVSAIFDADWSGAYLRAGSGERIIPVIWRCPSPRSSHGKPPAPIRERRAIAHRLAPFGLWIVGDAGWRDRRRPLAAALDVRSDWASLSCARERYGAARIALVTPSPGQEDEITADVLIAVASGALPVAPYTMAKALFDRFGDDCPVPLYKDVGEVVAIVDHYLREEEERVALIDRGAARLFGRPGYSAAVGDLGRSITIDA